MADEFTDLKRMIFVRFSRSTDTSGAYCEEQCIQEVDLRRETQQ